MSAIVGYDPYGWAELSSELSPVQHEGDKFGRRVETINALLNVFRNFGEIHVDLYINPNTATVRINLTFQMKYGLVGPQKAPSTFILERKSYKKPQHKNLSTVQIIWKELLP
ncbi:hypothetical protein TNCV_693431 [Trichonephila clavipes]|nr:hypothetical protein TNCV_693431 [Trichonephila clavipes]